MAIVLDGTNGIDTPNTFGFKNRIINGNFSVNQRAVSGTVSLSSGQYGHDRFKAGSSGCTYTFSTTNNVTTLTITAGSLQQVIEGSNLETGTYTLSWTGTAQGKIGAGSYSSSGVTGSITGGTNTTIEFNTGTLSLVQLEKGAIATPFDWRPNITELQLCQRYYETGTYNYRGGYSNSAVVASVTTPTYFKVIKRISPTVTGTNTQGTFSVTNIDVDSCQCGRSNIVADRNNNGTFIADAEL